MLSTYCQHCGSKNEYSSVKPKFCSSCGQPLAGDFNEAKVATKTQPKARSVAHIEDYDADGTDIFEVPQISRLEYDIEVSNSSQFTLGSIMPSQQEIDSTSVKKPTRRRKRPAPRKNDG
jgi:ribosomal protein L37E